MKRHLQFPLAGLVLLMVGMVWSASATAQMIGFVVEVDTVFYGADTPTPDDTFDPEGVLDGYASFIVYAEFTNPTDVLSAIFADVPAGVSDLPLQIDAPCGCWDVASASLTLAHPFNSLNFIEDNYTDFHLYEYDSFWTIGMLYSDQEFDGSPGDVPLFVTSEIDPQTCNASISDGSFSTTGSPPNAIAGDDFRVEVARVTTCGDWSFSANCQVFEQGMQSSAEIWLMNEQDSLDLNSFGFMAVEHPCQDYSILDPEINGLTISCAGETTNVEIEFLGSDDLPSTSYDLYIFDDDQFDQLDFSEGEVVGQLVEQTPPDVIVFQDLFPGNYAVKVEDIYGCMDTTRFTVVAPDPIEAMPSIGNQNSCFGEADASIVIPDSLLVGGTGDLNVTVSSPAGNPMGGGTFTDEGFELSGLVCLNGDGTYEVTTTDDNLCFRVDTVYVNCPEPIEWTVDWTDVVCAGASDGTIVAEASGGSGGELYLTNNQSAPVLLSAAADTLPLTASIGNLGPTIYQVWVYDALNCNSDTAFITVEEPAPLELSITNVTDLTCESDCDGSIEYTAIGGSGQLDVQFVSMPMGTPVDESFGLCVGDYLLQVTDTAGCDNGAEFAVDAPPPLSFIFENMTPATCTGMSDGTIDIFGVGGTVTLEEWSWYVVDSAGQQVATNLNQNGLNNLSEMIYSAHITDQIGCTHDSIFEVGVQFQTDMELSTLTSPVTCWGAADGTATVSVNGGEAPFTFEWSDPFSQTASTAVGLTEDTYTVVVTDALGCRRSASQAVGAIEGCLFIADALTPNNDGKNDDWVVGGLEDFPQSRVVVVNRWGQRVFETQGGLERWDGRFSGQRLPVADYYYTIELNPGSLPIRGTVTIKY